jgi:N4-gp56 family major capsid protein
MIDDFIPEIWAANLLVHLRPELVYASAGLINRNYEGEIADAGDTVHITQVGDVAVRSYTAESNISVDSVTDDTRALVIDQSKYFAFDVDDVIRRQAMAGWVDEAMRNAAFALANETDAFVSSTMYTAVNGTSNDIGAITADTSNANAYGDVFVALRTRLTISNVPKQGRWVVIHPDLYGSILQDARFVNAQASADAGRALHDGALGTIAGFEVYESNTVPVETAGVYSIIAGHPMATTFADQISSVEAQRRELRFGDLVKGLHLYGAKVVRPEALALASVTVQA